MCVVLMAFIFCSRAQEARSYADEELAKYAKVMLWVEGERDRMTGTYNDWIGQHELLGAPRFLALKRATGDSVALAEIGATTPELQAYQEIVNRYDSMTAAFKEVFVGKIKEELGAGLYNALKADLQSRAEIENRYAAILIGLRESSTEEEK